MKRNFNKSEFLDERNSYFDAYSTYNNNLRNWFVGYGIGFPIVVISNKDQFQSLNENSWFMLFSACICLGIIFQIISAYINKNCNWFNYRSHEPDFNRNDKAAAFFIYISEKYMIDVVIDLVTILLYAAATICVLIHFK